MSFPAAEQGGLVQAMGSALGSPSDIPEGYRERMPRGEWLSSDLCGVNRDKCVIIEVKGREARVMRLADSMLGWCGLHQLDPWVESPPGLP